MTGGLDRVHGGSGSVAPVGQVFERGEGVDVLAVLFASTQVAAPVFGADQSLRRAFAFGDVSHVQPASLDDPMEVLAAVLSNPEPVDLCHWIQDECLQFPAVDTSAGELDVLPPVGWCRGRVAASGDEEIDAVPPELGHSIVMVADPAEGGHQDGDRIEHGRASGQMVYGIGAQGRRIQPAQRIEQFDDERWCDRRFGAARRP
jgi:hypothetical protein